MSDVPDHFVARGAQGRRTPAAGTRRGRPSTALGKAEAENYAEWFAVLADPTRVRLLHTLSTSPTSAMRVGDLAAALGVSQSTCSHHVELLRKVGFVAVDKVGTSSMVSVNAACCTGLPHAADVVMGTLASPPCCPEDLPADVATRPVTAGDMDLVLAIYAEGLATRNATFETNVPTADQLRKRWLPDLAWVAELDGEVVGWTAITPVSARECYAGVGESSSTSPKRLADAASARRSCSPRSPKPTGPACGPCRHRSSPRTGPASPCIAPPATAPSLSAPASHSSTTSGATPCSLSDAAT